MLHKEMLRPPKFCCGTILSTVQYRKKEAEGKCDSGEKLIPRGCIVSRFWSW